MRGTETKKLSYSISSRLLENDRNTSVTTLAILDAPLATISKNNLPAFGLKTSMYLELTLGRQLRKLELRRKNKSNKANKMKLCIGLNWMSSVEKQETTIQEN